MSDSAAEPAIEEDKGQPLPGHSASSGMAIDWLLAAGLFAATAFVYVRTLCPTIFTDDCGEITTAIATGGVIHPPGYPLYTLLGGLFLRLLPWGEPAWRLGLLSALAASGAVAVSYFLARRAGAARVWAVAAALAFGFSLCLWQQATKVETYSLNALLVGLVFLAAARCEQTGKKSDFLIACGCCGLALTNHLTSMCAIVGALWLMGGMLRRESRPALPAAFGLVVFALPLGLYSLVWITAARHASLQVWGDPSELHRFVLHVTGARYHGYLFSQSTRDMAQRDLINLPATLWRNMGWFLIGIVPGVARGLISLRTRRMHVAMLIAGGAYLLETSAYGILNIFEYYTPLIMLLCIWAAVGMDGVVSGLLRRATRLPKSVREAQPVFAWSCCVLIAFTALFTHWRYCDRSHATFIRDFALNALNTLPPNSVVLAAGDNRVFPIWYAQDVLGVRRDVTVVPRPMLTSLGTPDGRDEMGWLVEKLRAQHPGIVDASAILSRCAADPSFAVHEGPSWQIAQNGLAAGDPVYMTDIFPGDIRIDRHRKPVLNALRPDFSVVQMGLAYQIVPYKQWPDLRRQLSANLALEQRLPIESAPDELMVDEPDGNITNHFYAQFLQNEGSLMIRGGNPSGSIDRMRMAVSLEPSAENYDQLGIMLQLSVRLAESAAAFRHAVELEPDNLKYSEDLADARQLTAANPPSETPVAHPGVER